MKPKKPGFFSRHQVLLPKLHPDANDLGKIRGMGFDTKKNRWFVSYRCGDKVVKEYNDCKTREDAVKEQERRYTELLLAGAKVVGQAYVPHKRTLLKKIDPDQNIYPVKVTVTRYNLMIQGKHIGTFNTKTEAREVRDGILEETKLKPCAVCGKRPEIIKFQAEKSYRHELIHTDCENAVRLKKMGKAASTEKWNKKLWKGKES